MQKLQLLKTSNYFLMVVLAKLFVDTEKKIFFRQIIVATHYLADLENC